MLHVNLRGHHVDSSGCVRGCGGSCSDASKGNANSVYKVYQRTAIGATAVSQCSICDKNVYTKGSDMKCAACPTGRNHAKVGSTSLGDCRSSCAVNHYLSGSKCLNCQALSSNAATTIFSINDCLCNAGAYGSGGSCTACNNGKYACINSAVGIAVACINCAAGKFSDVSTGATACSNCAGGKYATKRGGLSTSNTVCIAKGTVKLAACPEGKNRLADTGCGGGSSCVASRPCGPARRSRRRTAERGCGAAVRSAES